MIRTAIFFLVFWLYQVLILPLQLVVILLHALGRSRTSRHLASTVARNWARSLLWLAGCRCRIHGSLDLPPDQPALFVSNHQGAFDIPILLAKLDRPTGFVAKVELLRIPIVSIWMKHIGCVFLDREDRRQSLDTVKQAVTHLQEGTSMVIFPEGSRSNSPAMGDFKKGSLSMGLRAGVPIVPLTLSGTYRIRNGDRGLIKPAEIDLVIHPSLHPEQLTREQRESLTAELRERIQTGLENTAG